MTIDPEQAHLWIVGGGIAGMATAAFAIRAAGVHGQNRHLLEAVGPGGGALAAVDPPAIRGARVSRRARLCG